MNAVNLIPGEKRKRGSGVGVSPQTLGLLGALVLVLVAVVLYVTAANKVSSRKSELAQVSAGVTQWTVAGNSYASYVKAAQEHTKQLADVRQLAAARFPWSQLLGQIGGLMPRAAALSSLQASGPTAAVAGTAAGAAAVAATAPAVQLSGCAASQSTVAQTMVALHQVKGVTAVTLAATTDAGTGSGTASAAGGGGCPFPVQFQISLTFAATTTSPAATTSATPAVTGAATSATGAATSATTSTTATTATTTTAGAQ